MAAVKTLACSVAATIGMGMGTVHADSISRSRPGSPWTLAWPAESVSAYQALSTAPRPTANAGVNPIFASTPVPATADPVLPPASATNAAVERVANNPPPAPSPAIASPTSTAAPVDAFINMTTNTYPGAGTLTAATAQPWYDSPSVIKAFGGVPNAQQQANFVQTVLQDVQHTYQLSGMNPTLTTDPNTPALHTLSVASGLLDPSDPNAIGLTTLGGNGFSFIDKLNYATNPTGLAWAVAHSISHELMHAFGTGYHPDGGSSIDAASATWSTLTDPNTQFGPAATRLLLASQYGTLGGSSGLGVGAQLLNHEGTKVDGDMELLAVPAPEPAAVAIWVVGAFGGLALFRRWAGQSA
jgi:hypothetical protein